MTAPPNSRFWQIHLSTAVVLMLLVGSFVGLNIVPNKQTRRISYGWPIPIVARFHDQTIAGFYYRNYFFTFGSEFYPMCLVFAATNLLVGVLSAAGVTLLMERRIRGRDARKP